MILKSNLEVDQDRVSTIFAVNFVGKKEEEELKKKKSNFCL